MSGLEIAGLTLATIPILIEAIKAYRNTYDRIQTFRHAEKRLGVIIHQFGVCKLNFLTESRSLLELVLASTQLSQEMMTDTEHHLWQDETVERQLIAMLRQNMEPCAGLIAHTTATIQAFDGRLSKLQVSPNSPVGRIQRTRLSAVFVMEKSRFERDIASLRTTNADLNRLRSNVFTTEKHPHAIKTFSSEAQSKIKRLVTIRQASSSLYDTLRTAWSCLDTTHVRHSVKLCVDTDSKPDVESVTLDMAVSSEVAEQPRRDGFSAVWLYVKSDSIPSQSAVALPTQPNVSLPLIEALQLYSSGSSIATGSRPDPLSAQGRTHSPHDNSTAIDLCKVNCICSHLRSNASSPNLHQENQCIGYLTSSQNSRHDFFGPSTPGSVGSLASSPENTTSEITALEEIIKDPLTRRLQLLHQYQLALKISRSVLQFHNTPWLPQIWKMGDLSILGSSISDQSLATLHLSTRFDHVSVASTLNATTDASTQTPSSANPWCKLSPAVYNETLFCLGIVLLEISHLEVFETLRQGEIDEVQAAHRIVRGPPPLGPRYRKIVERCLRCDFGAGSEDLESEELQRAVWSKVVYPLEALVREVGQEA